VSVGIGLGGPGVLIVFARVAWEQPMGEFGEGGHQAELVFSNPLIYELTSKSGIRDIGS